ncbi:hypothetical protein [Nonomuraea harbinensis]|uniref:Uncharacterized protein n=1 Tax=Nonomuraea harbinensis TaxID=1286938 RepID=A0ABW1BYS1_9ACTN|nr:hypothetical protein [Nonomuraea harbinensis]
MPGVDTIDGLTRAVADFDTSGFELPMEEAALARARRSLMETGLLLLGEMPGVRENPLVILRLMDAFGLGSLALDWHGGLTMELYTYLRHGTPLESAQWWVGDGRVTAGHLAVLRRLSPITLTLFDGADRPDRDSAMARRVLDTVAAPTLVVAGSAHTGVTPDALGKPMGACLARERPGLESIRIDYGRGSFYAMERRGMDARAAARGLRVVGEELVVGLPEFSEATVPQLPFEALQGKLAQF